MERYFFVNFESISGISETIWVDDKADMRRLERGIIHLTLENAMEHFAAIVSTSKLGNK